MHKVSMYAVFQLLLAPIPTLLVLRVNIVAICETRIDTGNISHLTSCNWLFTHYTGI